MSATKTRIELLLKEFEAGKIATLTRRQLDALIRVYRQAERKITAEILSGAGGTNADLLAMQTTVRRMLRALMIFSNSWADEAFTLSYKRGVDITERQVQRLGIAASVVRDTLQHQRAVSLLVASMSEDTVRASASVENLVVEFIRRTKQTRALDNALSQSLAESLVQGNSTIQTRDAMLEALRGFVKEGELIRAGSRQYKPSDYIEMVARTRAREATTLGTLNTAIQYGMDLVLWDVHDNACPKCQPYLGRVFSISGTNKDFPQLVVRPPVHPNCECTIHPTTEIALRDSNNYSRLVALSNNAKIVILDDDDYRSILGKRAFQIANMESDIVRGQVT
jgi:hypothetical protein